MRWIVVPFAVAAVFVMTTTTAISEEARISAPYKQLPHALVSQTEQLPDIPVMRSAARIVCPMQAEEVSAVCVQVPHEYSASAHNFYIRFLIDDGWEPLHAEANAFGFKKGERTLVLLIAAVDRSDRQSDLIFHFIVRN